ncbi:uncharacterized protein EV422DRAFT_508143 [Fimicolochytrium jonesii]|uniref:uncharacterized protein n=1 Tax=Fimicolochytrium jonesii TaxID=1396493 RepID=UPI0022FEA4FB|nr:uncharacterized protein EV422DRAFT_508143 [Fimicolochytrium jonesii]KAI8818641.1 hypothetical protein EV422DRAFT_508143 [Fimicolochytrium jonesii]
MSATSRDFQAVYTLMRFIRFDGGNIALMWMGTSASSSAVLLSIDFKRPRTLFGVFLGKSRDRKTSGRPLLRHPFLDVCRDGGGAVFGLFPYPPLPTSLPSLRQTYTYRTSAGDIRAQDLLGLRLLRNMDFSDEGQNGVQQALGQPERDEGGESREPRPGAAVRPGAVQQDLGQPERDEGGESEKPRPGAAERPGAAVRLEAAVRPGAARQWGGISSSARERRRKLFVGHVGRLGGKWGCFNMRRAWG